MFPTNQNFLSANAGLSNGNNPCFPMYLTSSPTSQTIYAPYGIVQVGQVAIVPAVGAWILLSLLASPTGLIANWAEIVASTGNILAVNGTANQILSTTTAGISTLSLPITLIAPGTVASTSGFVGQTTGLAPSAGNIGEQIRSAIASGSAIPLTTATAANITSISLTPGAWDVSGVISFVGAGATDTVNVGSISTTSATNGTLGDNALDISNVTTGTLSGSIPSYRILVTTTQSVFLVANATFSAGTMSAYGRISATRVA